MPDTFSAAAIRAFVLWMVFAVVGCAAASDETEPSPAPRFPTIPSEHQHARALATSALLYAMPSQGMIDPASGYPFEGWNQEPARGVYMRSFTQLTAVGQWLEVLGSAMAGHVESPELPRDLALAQLEHAVASLRHDQHDPKLSSKGLLVNFIDLSGHQRRGPLATTAAKKHFTREFGPEMGEAIWRRLDERGWIARHAGDDSHADIQREGDYGEALFNGKDGIYGDPEIRRRVMQVLDQRVVLVVFGDNANLSASVAKTIGALTAADGADDPRLRALCRELEAFLDEQKDGYEHLYDPEMGLFYFGYNATCDRLFGWFDASGTWQSGHMDYLVNEFRGPAVFVALRYGLPVDAIANLGFTLKPYRMQDGKTIYVLAPWEGSAFQSLGLAVSSVELTRPSWRNLLHNAVEVQIDYARRNGLPGFLSESYTGEGARYTGDVGIPDIAVADGHRITEAASLYTLGPAYTVAPDHVESFLADQWPTIASLLTDHGPWEGFQVAKREPIRFQTTAHTFALLLGLIGTGPETMNAYLASRGLDERLAAIYDAGRPVDLMSPEVDIFAWADRPAAIQTSREPRAFHVSTEPVDRVGVALVAKTGSGVNLSGARLKLRYRSAQPMDVRLAFKSVGQGPDSRLIAKQIFARLAETGDGQRSIEVILPATPGLTAIKEIVLTHEYHRVARPLEFSITGLTAEPLAP